MKKKYNNPKIRITEFDRENIVCASSVTKPKTTIGGEEAYGLESTNVSVFAGE